MSANTICLALGLGSLEGDGLVFLGANNLALGSNNLSTTFSGTIQDGDTRAGGSLSKIGTGTLTLTSSNRYTGGTAISSGILLLNNVAGSGTGNHLVQVFAGTLGGGGSITGPVIVGTGSGAGAFLAPGPRGVTPGTFTISKKLTLKASRMLALPGQQRTEINDRSHNRCRRPS